MKRNPYQPAVDTPTLPEPIRVRRGRTVLLVISGMFVSLSVGEACAYDVPVGWFLLPLILFHAVAPLALLLAIWKGHTWARYALTALCVFILSNNLPLFQYLPRMIEDRHWVDAGVSMLLLVTHVAAGFLGLFSSAITALLHFRKDEAELEGSG